jgi:uncharacterized protein (TIGR00369 family)
MQPQELLDLLQANPPEAIKTLRGRIVSLDQEQQSATLAFTADHSMCNPNDGVQGGFICGMLDAAMAFAVFAALGDIAIVASLEIKISYFEITRRGELQAIGTVVRAGKTITFLEAELRNADGLLLATATSTARVIRGKTG